MLPCPTVELVTCQPFIVSYVSVSNTCRITQDPATNKTQHLNSHCKLSSLAFSLTLARMASAKGAVAPDLPAEFRSGCESGRAEVIASLAGHKGVNTKPCIEEGMLLACTGGHDGVVRALLDLQPELDLPA